MMKQDPLVACEEMWHGAGVGAQVWEEALEPWDFRVWEEWIVGEWLEGPRWHAADGGGGIAKRVRYFAVEEGGWTGCFVGRGEGRRQGGWGELQLGFCLRRRVVQTTPLGQECACHSAATSA